MAAGIRELWTKPENEPAVEPALVTVVAVSLPGGGVGELPYRKDGMLVGNFEENP